MITVYDFMNLCIDDDQIYTIYDFSKGDVVFTGTIRELPDELDNYNVVSFDSLFIIKLTGKKCGIIGMKLTMKCLGRLY